VPRDLRLRFQLSPASEVSCGVAMSVAWAVDRVRELGQWCACNRNKAQSQEEKS